MFIFVKQFLYALDSTNLTQHVSFSTHRDHHINDVVIAATSSLLKVNKVNFEIYIADRKATTCI